MALNITKMRRRLYCSSKHEDRLNGIAQNEGFRQHTDENKQRERERNAYSKSVEHGGRRLHPAAACGQATQKFC